MISWILLFNLLLSLSVTSFINGSMAKQLQERGLIEINNTDMIKNDYHKLYNDFDSFINLIDTNPTFAANLNKSEKEFLINQEQKKRYCGAPPSYRDPQIHKSKRFNKIYFQYIKEYHDQLKLNYMLPDSANIFLNNMHKLDSIAKIYFGKVLDQLEDNQLNIKKLLYGNNNELTVISKIVRYKKDPLFKWGTTPHFDKSALTLIWNSDDDDNESLIVCEEPNSPSIDKLHKPQRIYADQNNASSTILIVGSAAQNTGLNIKPTLHGVTDFKKDYRHAVISFLLVPDIDMSGFQTDYEIN